MNYELSGIMGETSVNVHSADVCRRRRDECQQYPQKVNCYAPEPINRIVLLIGLWLCVRRL